MSQSDFIRYKRLAVELRNQTKNLAPVIDSGKYTDYKAFTLENTIISNKPSYTKLQSQSTINVFGMQRNNASSCSTFTLCSGTNNRTNRKPLLDIYSKSQPLRIASTHTTPNKLNVCNYC
jgi:hypothetical protein